jgi:hypothetical protein
MRTRAPNFWNRFALAAVFTGLTAWTIATHWVTFGLDFPDDSFFTLVSSMWARGMAPYATTFDVKPPGLDAAAVRPGNRPLQEGAVNKAYGFRAMITSCVAVRAGQWLRHGRT